MVRAFNHYFSGRKTLVFFSEGVAIATLCLAGAWLAALFTAPDAVTPALPPKLAALSIGVAVLFQFLIYLLDLYDLRIAGQDRARGVRALKAAGVAVAVVGLAGMVVPAQWLPAGSLLGGTVGAVMGSFALRAALGSVMGDGQRVLVVGIGPKALEVSRAVDAESEGVYRVCSMLDPSSVSVKQRFTLSPEGAAEPGVLSLEESAAQLSADVVVVAPDDPRAVPMDALLQCRVEGLRVYDVAGFYERVLRRLPVSQLRAEDLAYSDALTVGRVRALTKRAFDLLVALAMLAVAAPLMLAIGVLVKLDSPGPVFYRQERVGRGGKAYRLWKFRSMRVDAEKNGAVWAKQNDDRVTRVGRFIRKTRMDELPQIFNVLVGQMSIVGPRPERPVFVAQLKAQVPFYGLREVVKPGITGWAQIRYPYGASVEDARNKLEYDLYYVKNGSLPFDLAIVFHTVRHVLLGRGAR